MNNGMIDVNTTTLMNVINHYASENARLKIQNEALIEELKRRDEQPAKTDKDKE